MKSFYRLSYNEVGKAASAMVDAFAADPLWSKLFEGQSGLDKKYQAFFEIPIRFCIKYGQVYAPTKNVEGVIAFVPGEYSNLTFWRLVRSGSFGSALRMGLKANYRITDLSILAVDRANYMNKQPYVYLQIIGIRKEFQGKKIGSTLIRSLMANCDLKGLPIYLETETQENVMLYTHLGFRLIRQVTLEKMQIPMWEMIREPG